MVLHISFSGNLLHVATNVVINKCFVFEAIISLQFLFQNICLSGKKSSVKLFISLSNQVFTNNFSSGFTTILVRDKTAQQKIFLIVIHCNVMRISASLALTS